MTKVIIVSHCILNTCAKVKCFDGGKSLEEERQKRIKFLNHCLSNEYQLIQLPCPEFLTFGSKRWGHARSQFDNAFYRDKCRQLLWNFLEQIKEYNNDSNVKLLGMVGIDGSPTCGVDKTFDADWGGEMSTINNLDSAIKNGGLVNGSGILVQEFRKLLKEQNINLPIVPLGKENELPGFD